jgi:hypothetical protein
MNGAEIVLSRFSSEVDTGSREENASNNKLVQHRAAGFLPGIDAAGDMDGVG